jgi:hypothetical protein
VLWALGDQEAARVQFERAVVISEEALGSDHPTVAAIRSNLNSMLLALQEATRKGPASAG